MTNRTSTIDKIRNDRRVEFVDDERAMGNSIIITLRQGWSFDPLQDNRVTGADTASELLKTLRRTTSYAGPYTE